MRPLIIRPYGTILITTPMVMFAHGLLSVNEKLEKKNMSPIMNQHTVA
jgi:hypothetical protein